MDKLPLEILREKYVPLVEFSKISGISIRTIEKLIEDKRIRYAEFKAPGDLKRTPHVNPEEIYAILEEEGIS